MRSKQENLNQYKKENKYNIALSLKSLSMYQCMTLASSLFYNAHEYIKQYQISVSIILFLNKICFTSHPLSWTIKNLLWPSVSHCCTFPPINNIYGGKISHCCATSLMLVQERDQIPYTLLPGIHFSFVAKILPILFNIQLHRSVSLEICSYLLKLSIVI